MRIVRLIMRVLFLTPLFIFIGLLGIILKSFGRDKLKLKKKELFTYWVFRKDGMPVKNSFKSQKN